MDAKKEIEKTLKDYYKAFHEKDWERFGSFLNDNFTYFTDKTIVMNREKFLDFLRKDTWQPKGYDIYDINIYISEKCDLAYSSYKTSFYGSNNGNDFTVYAIETTIFRNENGIWNIVHSHTSNKV